MNTAFVPHSSLSLHRFLGFLVLRARRFAALTPDPAEVLRVLCVRVFIGGAAALAQLTEMLGAVLCADLLTSHPPDAYVVLMAVLRGCGASTGFGGIAARCGTTLLTRRMCGLVILALFGLSGLTWLMIVCC